MSTLYLNEIAKRYGFDKQDFEKFAISSGINVKYHHMMRMYFVDTKDIDELVTSYGERHEKLNQFRIEQAHYDIEREKVLPSILITSGFSFDGYTITKYSGYISGDDAIQVSRGSDGIFSNPTNVGKELMKSLSIIRRNALQELKKAAYDLGCNAVIGVDFDYITLDPQTANFTGGTTYLPYVFGVTANGNAVIIEKND